MPRYTYKCEKCENIFQTRHSINEKLEKCPKCDADKGLRRLLSMPMYKLDKNKSKQKVGDITKQHIKDARQDLKRQKEDVKREIKRK